MADYFALAKGPSSVAALVNINVASLCIFVLRFALLRPNGPVSAATLARILGFGLIVKVVVSKENHKITGHIRCNVFTMNKMTKMSRIQACLYATLRASIWFKVIVIGRTYRTYRLSVTHGHAHTHTHPAIYLV